MEYYKNFLNCGRNSIRYIIRAYNIKTIHIPYYTCPTVWCAARIENCKVKFYHIDKFFIPTKKFFDNDYILYTNYFGVNAKNILELSKKYKNLIIDNSQAFFMPEIGIAGFNSLRKFFPTVDGSYVYTTQNIKRNFENDNSYLKVQDKYGELNPENYDLYRNRNFNLNEEIKNASEKTVNENLCYKNERKNRILKFNILKEKLDKYNELNIDIHEYDVPYVYPLLNSDITIKFEKYWGKQPQNTTENYLQQNLSAIPIDFRYPVDLFRSNDFYKGILRHKRSASTINTCNKE